ncbi:MAG: hypothetical protein OXL38_09675, partial [Gammaproteobacteria bacterium]|nr:hypothetical protein [Gammaproteobacteria bacterium]
VHRIDQQMPRGCHAAMVRNPARGGIAESPWPAWETAALSCAKSARPLVGRNRVCRNPGILCRNPGILSQSRDSWDGIACVAIPGVIGGVKLTLMVPPT